MILIVFSDSFLISLKTDSPTASRLSNKVNKVNKVNRVQVEPSNQVEELGSFSSRFTPNSLPESLSGPLAEGSTKTRWFGRVLANHRWRAGQLEADGEPEDRARRLSSR